MIRLPLPVCIVLAGLGLLSACATNSTAHYSPQAVQGRHLYSVVAEYTKAGLDCGGQDLRNQNGSMTAQVVCGVARTAPQCRSADLLVLSYDPRSLIVSSMRKVPCQGKCGRCLP